MASQNSTVDCGINEDARAISISTLYFLLFPPALLLNLLVAWISTHLNAKTTFMVYLKHLVAADLLMTLTFPIRAASDLPSASEGLKAFACRFGHVFFYLAMNMSIILMGLISLDRFFKVVQPGGKLLFRNLFLSKVLAVSSWLLVIGSNTLPVIITTNQYPRNKTRKEFCMTMKSDVGLLWHEAVVKFAKVVFWTVCVVVILSYICIAKRVVESYRRSCSNNAQTNRKAKFRVFLILLVFLICYVPYHVVRLPYTNHQVKINDTCIRATLKVVKDVTLWVSATNVCLDPLIYFFLCKAFRKRFMEVCERSRIFKSFAKKNAEACQSSDTSF